MYGLTMLKEYLNEFLEGQKTYDARAYTTDKRGTIALIDSRSLKVYGYAELVGVREISFTDYADWHCSKMLYKFLDIYPTDASKKYYAWEFENIRKEDNPFKVEGKKKTWMVVEVNKKVEQLSLF